MLKALPGVERVRAQARKQRIEVLFDAGVIEATVLAERISKAGYQTKAVS